MNKNEIFKRFLKNPGILEKANLTETQIKNLDLYSDTSNRLINVIKIAVLHLDSEQSVDLVARKINQYFKRENK